MGTLDFAAVAPLLKRTARERRLTYRQIGQRLGLSESAVKKILNGRDCSLNRLVQICAVLAIDPGDILGDAASLPLDVKQFTRAQEEFLARDRVALAVLWKLWAERLSRMQIARQLRLRHNEIEAVLYRLDRHGLIRYAGGRQLRVPDPDHVSWSLTGPLASMLLEEWTQSLLGRAVRGRHKRGYRVNLRYVRVSPSGAAEFDAAVDELLTELERRAARDRRIGRAELGHYSVLVAVAPESMIDSSIDRNAP